MSSCAPSTLFIYPQTPSAWKKEKKMNPRLGGLHTLGQITNDDGGALAVVPFFSFPSSFFQFDPRIGGETSMTPSPRMKSMGTFLLVVR